MLTLLRLALLLLVLIPGLSLAAPGPLVLEDRLGRVDAWPAVTVLSDPGGTLRAEEALAAAAKFAAPTSAYATLGVHKDVVWLRIPIALSATSGADWILDIDYAVINRVDVFVVTDGQVKRHPALGNLQPVQANARGGRAPAVLLPLKPGQQQLILLRIENVGSMILPIRLSKPGPFHADALNEQMLQGLLIGLSVCLLLYSVAQWINLREPLFGKYALLIGGTTMFSVEFFGLGSQYIWKENAWMNLHAGGLFALMASCGAYLFVEQALARPGTDRLFSRLMKTGAVLCVVSALAYALDVISVETLVAIVSTLGLMPMLLGLPGAFKRARSGDAVGTYFLAGWAVAFASSVILSQVINGAVPANFWTMHALQFGNLFDMLVFMRILALRTRQMQDAMLRAEAATRMKSDFLANMSHEIRTPLNAIIGMSRLSLMADPQPKLRNYLSKILGSGEHLLGVLNDILDFSKIEAGKLKLEAVPFDLDEMLEHLSGVTAIKAGAKPVELVFRVERGVPTRLVGDPLRIGQVLINLTSNAVKFTEHGEIVVAVDTVERCGGALTLRFSVTDTGIGMNKEQLAQLFQSFNQADNSITRRYGGTGLGLSISKQLVELLGGAIEATSTPGAGSRFTFTVQLGIGDPDAAAVTLSAAALHQARVMVVDDSATSRDALVEMLASFGVTAHAASSGEQSLAMLARAVDTGEPYQVVLMDYMMPGWDGVETIRRIHADVRFPAPPAILMVSASSRETVLQNEGDVPLHAFLTKPVGPALLYHSLFQVLHPELAVPQRDAGELAQHNAPGIQLPDLARLDGARILLVEDNANNREVALDFLASARMQVDVAVHGGEAVQMAQEADYDLVLMDIQMQEVDGLTAARRIRAIKRLQHVPIVAMTAHAMAGDREKSLDAGMNDHVTKPIDPALLFRTLLNWIDPARLAGRQLPPPSIPGAAQDDAAALPAISGVDWRQALANVDGQHSRLHKRIRGFLLEYRDAPPTLRDALAGTHYGAIESLTHNLKSSAFYLGASGLSALANTVELELRAGRFERIDALVTELRESLETVLGGLGQIEAPVVASRYAAADGRRLVDRLENLLKSEDARAEDALHELQTLLAGSRHAGVLAAVQRAVDDIEYHAALVPLAELAQALDMDLKENA
ncbi:response regulator [Massilia sp. RP-1-19]|uniref:Virulence sensor protein BvgS n=1 Tax=Massilia polaris TaxID=2728846 RepID=A0A848HGP6_9BURK|nr:hybrid sensor histidine kinase/response regulator [Massilia polaris]NML60142.1 response regulator [Massilia polaris]